MEPLNIPQAIGFLDEQSQRHSAFFSASPKRIMALVASCSQPHCHPRVLVRRLVGVTGTDKELALAVEGALPGDLGPGERISASIVNLRTYDGYQLKSREISPATARGDVLSFEGSRSTVRCSFAYTIHHSPNTKEFFQRIPHADIARHARNVRYAFIGIGPNVNVSPRFVWYYRTDAGKVHLYWGDGHLNKTAANMGRNLSVTLAVLDLASYKGMAFHAIGRRFSSSEDPDTWRAIEVGFSSGDWGSPSVTIDAALHGSELIEPV